VNFAREGIPFILIAMALAAAAYAGALARRSWPLWLLAFVLTLLVLWVAYFFRDPERSGARGEQLVISPADGRVIDISRGRRARLPARARDPHLRLHERLQRARQPVSGEREGRLRALQPGQVPQCRGRQGVTRERADVHRRADASRHRVLFRQIAGLIARRIVTYSREGDDAVEQGERMGLIRFGSRVDVFVPVGSVVKVKLGEKPQAGVTVLAELPK
jgi:phosphatidylserine decarboxylase